MLSQTEFSEMFQASPIDLNGHAAPEELPEQVAKQWCGRPHLPSEIKPMCQTQKRTHGFFPLINMGLIVLCLSSVATLAPAASKSSDDKPPIPRDLFFETQPVPGENNAIHLWRRAAKVQTKADADLTALISYAWKPEAPLPNEEQATVIKHWLKQNAESLQLVEQSLKKPAARWLATRVEEEQPELLALVQMTRARIVKADNLALEGKWDEAAELLEGNLRLAQIGIEAQAALIHYLVGGAVRSTTQRAMVRLANHRETPPRILKRLLVALPSLDSETNAYVRLLNVEFTVYEYPGVDVKWFAEAWAKPDARRLVSLTYDEEFQRPFMVLTDPGLVSLHPRPFDQLATLQRTAETYRRYRTNALSLWTNRIEADEEAINRVQQKLLKEIEPLMELLESEALPLDQKGVAKARKLYLALTDPIGRILQCQNPLLSTDDSRVVKNRTEREAVRATIAAIFFERQKDQLPLSLVKMQEEQFLPKLPWDYFANAPLNYSKERRLIWSLGEDAEDDSGDGSPETPWVGSDAVWRIPTRIK
jgi:hypothetical protein